MVKVTNPREMNETFARSFNARSLDDLLGLYEADAILRTDAEQSFTGRDEIATALDNLLRMPGTLHGRNNFCIVHGEIALLRADYKLVAPDGSTVMSGSSAEIVRRQADGSWRYVVDHAVGASLPRVDRS